MTIYISYFEHNSFLKEYITNIYKSHQHTQMYIVYKCWILWFRDAKPTGMKTIMCRMDKYNKILTPTNLIVSVDKDTPLIFSGMFYFVENPTIIPLSPKNATVLRR